MSQTLALHRFAKAKDVMQSVVMEKVVGSSPTRGAKKMQIAKLSVFFLHPFVDYEHTTTGYPGARRSAQAFNCAEAERVQRTKKRG